MRKRGSINYEMKKYILVVTIMYVVYCSTMGLEIPDVNATGQYRLPIVKVRGIKQAIIYVKENNNDELLYSIIKDVILKQSYILLRGTNISMSVRKLDISVIILTNTMDSKDLETDAFQILLSSYWSPLYLLITTRNVKYACVNGTLHESVFAETKNYLNEIWQRFQIVRIIASFPYTCPRFHIIFDNKEESGTTLYNRTIKLIKPRNERQLTDAIIHSGRARYLTHDYPLRTTIFHRFPTSISDCDVVNHYTTLNYQQTQVGYCGLDGLIMRDFVNHYKYNITIDNTERCDTYGYINRENNITTGSLACVLKEKVDMSFNSRFMVYYTKQNFYYLHYVTQDSLCVTIKRPDRVPLWHYAHNAFNANICLALITSLSLLGVTTWVSAKMYRKIYDQRPLKLYSYILDAIISTIFGYFTNKERRFRILKGACLLCSIVLLAIYQGHVNNEFATRSRYKAMKTLKQLYNSPYILYTSPSIWELLTSNGILHDGNQAALAFMKRARKVPTTHTGYLLPHSDTVTVSRKQDVMIEVLKSYTDKYGPLLYVIDECFQVFYLSFISRQGFLFIEESNKFMMRLLEAGLPNKYYMWTRRTYNLADTYPSTGPQPRPYKRIKLSKLRTAFGFLILGYVMSGIVFFIEKWKGKKEKIHTSNRQRRRTYSVDDGDIDKQPNRRYLCRITTAKSI